MYTGDLYSAPIVVRSFLDSFSEPNLQPLLGKVDELAAYETQDLEMPSMFDTIENAIAATIDEIKKNPNRQYDDSLYENMPSYDIMCQLVKAKFSIPNVKPKKRISQISDLRESLIATNGSSANVQDSLTVNDTILQVVIYHPTRKSKLQEFLVLGTNTLTELKDKILCIEDNLLQPEETPSSYFFIENTAYDDQRAAGAAISADQTSAATGQAAADAPTSTAPTVTEEGAPLLGRQRISDPVVHWCKSRLQRLGHSDWGIIAQENAESVRFQDLSVRLGAHYLYCHQGNCEHVMSFMDIREVDFECDVLDRSKYPLCIYEKSVVCKKCHACKFHDAVYECFGDKLFDTYPALFCRDCYISLHYDEHLQLIRDDFRVVAAVHE